MLNCFNAIKLVNSGECLGDLYWDPVFICVPGEGWELGQANVVATQRSLILTAMHCRRWMLLSLIIDRTF